MLVFFLLVLMFAALFVELVILASFVLAFLFGYGVYLLFAATNEDNNVPTKWAKSTGGILCVVISCCVTYMVLYPTHKPQQPTATPAFQTHLEGVTPSKFLLVRGLSFRADGPVNIYSGHEGQNDEKLLLSYTPGMFVHLSIIPGPMDGIYPTVHSTIRVDSENREVKFVVDYEQQ